MMFALEIFLLAMWTVAGVALVFFEFRPDAYELTGLVMLMLPPIVSSQTRRRGTDS